MFEVLSQFLRECVECFLKYKVSCKMNVATEIKNASDYAEINDPEYVDLLLNCKNNNVLKGLWILIYKYIKSFSGQSGTLHRNPRFNEKLKHHQLPFRF